MIEMILSGFLFLLILALTALRLALGFKMEIDESTSDSELKKLHDEPKKFQTGIIISLLEHVLVITLGLLLYVSFSSYSLILAIVWTIFRVGEGLILIYNKKDYWTIFKIAKQYSDSDVDKSSLITSAKTFFGAISFRFKVAIIFWSVGTLAYSIVFVVYGVLPEIIGWLGIVAGILVGMGNGLQLVKPNVKVLDIGGLVGIIFEVILGGWLLFSPLI
jgi:hypothetical protein